MKSFNLFMILDSLYQLIEKSSIIRFFKFNSKLLEGLSKSDLILLRNIWKFVNESSLYLFNLINPPERFNEFSFVLEVSMLVEFKIEVLIFSIKIRVSFLWSRIFKLFTIISPLYLKSILEISTLEFRVDVIFDEILNNIL